MKLFQFKFSLSGSWPISQKYKNRLTRKLILVILVWYSIIWSMMIHIWTVSKYQSVCKESGTQQELHIHPKRRWRRIPDNIKQEIAHYFLTTLTTESVTNCLHVSNAALDPRKDADSRFMCPWLSLVFEDAASLTVLGLLCWGGSAEEWTHSWGA